MDSSEAPDVRSSNTLLTYMAYSPRALGIRFTPMGSQARIEAKRQAQQRLVQTILSEENDMAPEIQGRSDVTMM
jgi:hypothetical protein